MAATGIAVFFVGLVEVTTMGRRGCAYQRKGRRGWHARVPIDGALSYKGGFSTKAMAEAWIAEQLRKEERSAVFGVPLIRAESKFEEFLPIWKASIKPPRLAARTHQSYVSIAEGILRPYFGGRKLLNVRAIDIEEFLNRQADRGVAPATLNRYLATLSSIFKYALKKKHIAENPVRHVSRVREKLPPIRYLSREDEVRLLAACPAWLRPGVLAALDGGLRAGEIGKLTRKDIDLSRGVITVRESKNRQPRDVGMTRRLHESLTKHLSTLPKGQETAFRTPKGRPFSPGGYRHAFEQATSRAGLDRFRFHDLRHACGVRLAENGATPGEISAFLGHKTLAMTLRYIRHAPRDAARSVARLLEQPGQTPPSGSQSRAGRSGK
ncbi:MAG: tyrosine-type recombinase/integrase [Planctomycetota bacterium]